MSQKLPHIDLYPGDWLRDAVSGCSLAAQGLWLRMMFVAHDSERYGYLEVNGSPMQPETIARRCGCDLAQYETLLSELAAAGVPSSNDKGTLFSRRMVRDANLRDVRAKAGRKGGKQSGKQRRSKREAKSKQNTDNDSDNDIDVDNAIADGFEKFWKVVPHKVSRGAAERAYKSAFRRLLERGDRDPATILETKMRLFAASPIGQGDPQFCPHPSTWLNGKKYDDDPRLWLIRRHDPRGTIAAAEEYLANG